MKKEIVKKALRITIPILVAGIILLFIYIIFSVPKGIEKENKLDKTRFCLTKKDCVPVDCGCTCAGGNGFSYDDVVNKKYVDKWYKEHECKNSTPNLCPMVICPERKVVCQYFMCNVKEGN